MTIFNTTELNQLMNEDRKEGIESLDYIRRDFGDKCAREILQSLQNHALQSGIEINDAALNTPYVDSIAPELQAVYPGDLQIEKRIENILRWNAMAMVVQAYDSGSGVGDHIATDASAAAMF
jgi:pyruvate dehydrogenase E1 component